MKIDNNELAKLEHELSSQGFTEKSLKIKEEFFRQIEESGIDHCSCPEACIHHGNCYECVALHRGHRDHLPYCFWDMVNEKMEAVSAITEGSFKSYQKEDDQEG